ncbi:MAG: chitobiase/beta-hexosaminidase C-terminal domain-containing protein, partial [Clostridia bacterium]
TEGASIYFKLSTSNFSTTLTPSNSTVYNGFSLETEGTYYIKAYAVKDGMFDSNQTSTQKITITKCAAPTISVASSGTRKVVTVTTTETDGDIFYTTDGTTPDSTKNKYVGPVTIGSNCTFKAVTAKKGCVTSTAVSKSISASGGDESVETPTPGGVENSDGSKTFALTNKTSGASIYYEITSQSVTDYNVTTADKLYTEPFTISESGSYYIYYIAYKNGVYSTRGRISTTVTMAETDRPAIPNGSAETLANGVRVFRLTSTTPDCKIYYILCDEKTDEVPVTEENLYTYPITITETKYVCAIAVNSEGVASPTLAGKLSVTDGPVTPDKVGALSLSTSSVSGGVNAYIDCVDTVADIFYTFDSNPSGTATTADTAYTRGNAITLTTNGYLHVLAARPGYEYNAQTYTITMSREKTAAPVITKGLMSGGSSYMIRLTSTTPDAKFYYTIDGTIPTTTNGTENTDGFAIIPGGVTLKVIAVADGYDVSDVVTEIMTESEAETCLGIISEETDIIGGKSIRLASMTEGATIYYTTNGTEPTENSLVYNDTDRIKVLTEGTTEIRAVAVKSGYNNSEIFSKEVTLQKLATPRAGAQQVGAGYRIQIVAEEGAEIRYTLDGTIPNSESTLYTNYFMVEESVTIKAVAMRPGYVTSDLYTGSITIDKDKVASPIGSLGLVLGGKMLTLKCATEGASIYYGIDGADPTILYTGPVRFGNEQNTISVIAKKDGMTDSEVLTYKLAMDKAATPKASVESGIVTSGTEVELSADKFVYKSSNGTTTEYECT